MVDHYIIEAELVKCHRKKSYFQVTEQLDFKPQPFREVSTLAHQELDQIYWGLRPYWVVLTLAKVVLAFA